MSVAPPVRFMYSSPTKHAGTWKPCMCVASHKNFLSCLCRAFLLFPSRFAAVRMYFISYLRRANKENNNFVWARSQILNSKQLLRSFLLGRRGMKLRCKRDSRLSSRFNSVIKSLFLGLCFCCSGFFSVKPFDRFWRVFLSSFSFSCLEIRSCRVRRPAGRRTRGCSQTDKQTVW